MPGLKGCVGHKPTPGIERTLSHGPDRGIETGIGAHLRNWERRESRESPVASISANSVRPI